MNSIILAGSLKSWKWFLEPEVFHLNKLEKEKQQEDNANLAKKLYEEELKVHRKPLNPLNVELDEEIQIISKPSNSTKIQNSVPTLSKSVPVHSKSVPTSSTQISKENNSISDQLKSIRSERHNQWKSDQ